MIDSKKFKEYLINECPSNLRFIKSIRFNKKSITLKCDNDFPIFNEFFTKQFLYGVVISYLSSFIIDNNVDFPSDRDYLKYRFSKLNIR